MKVFFRGLYYSLPVQLLLLHIRKFQLLLLFWFILFSTINSTFMKSYGADSLYLAPEYLGKVNIVSALFVGAAIGIFIMSWNITTFILFSRHFRFLATTSNPFLKYCINNAVLPLAFLVFYFFKAVSFSKVKMLMDSWDIFWLVLGFLVGLIVVIAISLLYFFRADRTIIRRLTPLISNPQLFKAQFRKNETRLNETRLMRVEWYLKSPFTLKKVRDVSHYSKEFIETIFNRHHFAAVLSIFVAFIFLIIIGFFLDNPYFQLPAASGITIFFAILIAVSGAFSYFLQSWSIPAALVIFFVLNLLYRYNVIDPSNKAYGLNYKNKKERPEYSKASLMSLCTPDKLERDTKNMIAILDKWKQKQHDPKPIMFIINASGGGNRSATFVMNVLQQLDSLSGGKLMDKTFMVSGASGGMLGMAYFRELVLKRESEPNLNVRDAKYVDDISGDLLNSLFTSMVARDLAAPAQKFSVDGNWYIKDRGYAFEQKLNTNTRGLLDKQMRTVHEDEKEAKVPLMILNSVVTRDGRKMVLSAQPVSFLMKPAYDTNRIAELDADAIDFGALFAKQNPLNLRLLTALRMNATFPYVLPNVWLPSDPVVDVMDAGLRDNYGQETTTRFVQVFEKWLKENTRGVVQIQISDRKTGGWDFPFESNNITEVVTRPMLLLQNNWYKMQEYGQNDQLSLSQMLLDKHFYRLGFQYSPKTEDGGAALNFHLTRREKQDIAGALYSDNNQAAFRQFSRLMQSSQPLFNQ